MRGDEVGYRTRGSRDGRNERNDCEEGRYESRGKKREVGGMLKLDTGVGLILFAERSPVPVAPWPREEVNSILLVRFYLYWRRVEWELGSRDDN
jgi:hypothetical protein